MDPERIAVLATPIGFVLLWWRMAVVEREVKSLREDRHSTNAALARMQGATDVMVDLIHTIHQRG